MTSEAIRWIVDGYLECGLWSTTICGGESDMEPMDDHYDIDDCANRDDVERQIGEFVLDVFDDFLAYIADLEFQGSTRESACATFGHDFLLTRDRHGAGFWDRGLGILGDRLTQASHPYGDSEFYPDYNDDESLGPTFTAGGSTP